MQIRLRGTTPQLLIFGLQQQTLYASSATRTVARNRVTQGSGQRSQLIQQQARAFVLSTTCPATASRQNKQQIIRTFSMSSSASSSVPAAPGWDLKANPFPQARRDESAGRTYKSAKEGGKEVKVSDPYMWLEEPPSQSAETQRFVEAQAELTSSYIAKNKDREAFKKKVEENFSYPRIGIPVLKNNERFYLHYNSGLGESTGFGSGRTHA